MAYIELHNKVDEISNAIGRGVTIPTDGGFIVLEKDALFSQDIPTDDNSVKASYLSMILYAYTT